MITPQYCLEFVKRRLGVPYVPFELSDDELMFWLQHTVNLFSTKIPWKKVVELDTRDTSLHTPERNVYKIPAPSKIISVLNVYAPVGNYLVAGHPLAVAPANSLTQQITFYSRIDTASIAQRNSYFYFTYEFLPPDMIRITPSFNTVYGIELEMEHLINLQTIPGEWEHVFLKMYTAQVARVLSTIRSMYRTYSTPIGDIELNPEALDALADKIDEELSQIFENINPGIIVVKG